MKKIPFDVDWDHRLYSAMKVLSSIVSNYEVYEGCVVALDEWFSNIVVDLFRRSKKAGMGVMEGFLSLIGAILRRFATNKEVMGQCKLSAVICEEAHDELIGLITSSSSTLITRASALEICPLLMMTSKVGAQIFARHCLVAVLDDGRFNPFEPGDIAISRTFERGEEGTLKMVGGGVEGRDVVGDEIEGLMFRRKADVFLDQEAVQRLTFFLVIKAMNILSQQIMRIQIEDGPEGGGDAAEKDTERKPVCESMSVCLLKWRTCCVEVDNMFEMN